MDRAGARGSIPGGESPDREKPGAGIWRNKGRVLQNSAERTEQPTMTKAMKYEGYDVVAELDDEGCLVLTVTKDEIKSGKDREHVLVEDGYSRSNEEGGWINAYKVVKR